jgi:hypothetical protein
MRVKAGFDEAAHPRDETGKFAEGGGGASGDEEITEIEMDEDREMQRFQDAAESLASGLDLDPSMVQEEIADWAMDSQSKSGLLFQVAASQEFGLSMPQYLLDKAKTAGINVNADFAEERAILRVLHEKSSIRGDVTLYRGTTQESQENPLESWTTDRGIAAFYVRRNGEGRVVEQRFPASRILATHHEGVGLESAKEVVVLGSGG